jgi:hypothetical protein
MAVPPIPQPFNYQARHLQLLEWLCGQIDSGLLGGGGGGGSSSDVAAGLDLSNDIESIKTQLGNLAVLTTNSQAIIDQLGLAYLDNSTQVRDAIDNSDDIDQIKSALQQLVNASAPQASQFITAQNYSYDPYCIGKVPFAVTFEVPAGSAWKPLALRANVITSNTVANRHVVLDLYAYDPISPRKIATVPAAAQMASQAASYTFIPGAPVIAPTSAGLFSVLPMPDLILGPLSQIVVSIYNYQTGTPVDTGFADGSVCLSVTEFSSL